MQVLNKHNHQCIIHLQYYKNVIMCLFCRFPQFWSTNCLPRYFLWSMYNYLTGNCFLVVLSCYLVRSVFEKSCQKYEQLTLIHVWSSLSENRLLLRRECCSYSNGQYIKDGLTQLKHWCNDVSREVVHYSIILLYQDTSSRVKEKKDGRWGNAALWYCTKKKLSVNRPRKPQLHPYRAPAAVTSATTPLGPQHYHRPAPCHYFLFGWGVDSEGSTFLCHQGLNPLPRRANPYAIKALTSSRVNYRITKVCCS